MHTTSNEKDQNHTVLSQQQANVVCCGQYTKAFQQPADFPTAAHDAPSEQQISCMIIEATRHRASTSMYSLTFCIRVMLPERHQWKPAVQATAVMLRTLPVDGQSQASQPRPLPIYAVQFWERPAPSPASHRPAARAHPAERSHYVVISRDGRKLVTRVCMMLP